MYGKLIDGALILAPKKIINGDSTIYNPPVEMLAERGYKPIIETPEPEAPEGYHYELSFEDDGDEIVYVWTLYENEPTPEEILDILTGEAE